MPAQSWSSLVETADVDERKVLDPGEYDLVLRSVKVGQTQKGDKKFACRYQVESGPHKGTTVWDNITILTDPDKQVGLQINMRKLFNLGADIKFLQGEPSDEQIVNKIVGARVIATLEVREWNGEDQNSFKSMKANKDSAPAATPAPAPAPASEPAAEAQPEEDAPQEEAPKTTKRRGSLPLPPAP